jgi:glycine oxidase
VHDHIIVGQGIAGSVLALTLIKAGKKVLVIDDDRVSHSSVVAAGLVNPVVPKRLSLTWKAAELIPSAREFYRQAEELLGRSFYHDREMIKVFSEENEKEFWLKHAAGDMQQYLSSDITDFFPSIINEPFGTSRIKQAANLETPVFLDAVKAYLISRSSYLQDTFDHDRLEVAGKSVHYKDHAARMIIFCEGFRANKNPYFSWLPFVLTKGEVLTVRIKNYSTASVINKGVFILPLGEDLFKVGATFRWEDETEEPTRDARAELQQKLEKILKVPYEVVDHKAGIRPTVKDRRPLIGIHPAHSQIAIFNGLGSKGVMIAPYCAASFYKHLEHGAPLDEEIDIRRFYTAP